MTHLLSRPGFGLFTSWCPRGAAVSGRAFGRAAWAAACLALAACSVPRWPVEGPVTSAYGLRWQGLRPTLHHGVDVAVPQGTPVRAMSSARVTHAGPLGGYGLTVILDHGRGWTTLYAHLSEVRVRPGTRIGGRDVIGLAGRTGRATGPHLHFEARHRGRPQDPVPLLGGFP